MADRGLDGGRFLDPAFVVLLGAWNTARYETNAGYDAQSISAVQDADVLTTVDVSFNYEPMFDVKEIAFSYFLSLKQVTAG